MILFVLGLLIGGCVVDKLIGLMVKEFNLACEIEQWQQKFAH